MADLVPGEVVAIDGKTVRRSCDHNGGKRAIHLGIQGKRLQAGWREDYLLKVLRS